MVHAYVVPRQQRGQDVGVGIHRDRDPACPKISITTLGDAPDAVLGPVNIGPDPLGVLPSPILGEASTAIRGSGSVSAPTSARPGPGGRLPGEPLNDPDGSPPDVDHRQVRPSSSARRRSKVVATTHRA
jgi:hypothetical protein